MDMETRILQNVCMDTDTWMPKNRFMKQEKQIVQRNVTYLWGMSYGLCKRPWRKRPEACIHLNPPFVSHAEIWVRRWMSQLKKKKPFENRTNTAWENILKVFNAEATEKSTRDSQFGKQTIQTWRKGKGKHKKRKISCEKTGQPETWQEEAGRKNKDFANKIQVSGDLTRGTQIGSERQIIPIEIRSTWNSHQRSLTGKHIVGKYSQGSWKPDRGCDTNTLKTQQQNSLRHH